MCLHELVTLVAGESTRFHNKDRKSKAQKLEI